MTAIVDKKSVGNSPSLKAIARSRCQAQTGAAVWWIAARSRGWAWEGWRTPRRFAKFRCPFNSVPAFGVRSAIAGPLWMLCR